MRPCALGMAYAYYACLQEILAFCAGFLRMEIPRPARIHRFLIDEEFRKRYDIAQLPDTVFVDLFEKAMHGPSLQIIEHLTTYVHERTGGFSLDGWILRRRMLHKATIYINRVRKIGLFICTLNNEMSVFEVNLPCLKPTTWQVDRHFLHFVIQGITTVAQA